MNCPKPKYCTYRIPGIILGFLITLIPLFSHSQLNTHNLTLTTPEIIVQHVPATFKVVQDVRYDTTIKAEINGKTIELVFENGEAPFEYVLPFTGKQQIVLTTQNSQLKTKVDPIPLWLSILPPLIAIFLALLIREVFTSIFTGILVGTTIIAYYKGASFFVAIAQGIFAIADTYFIESIGDTGHLSIIIFSMTIGAMVNLITRNGGMKGVVNKLSKYARSARSGQFITWLLGIMIFFDDYANTLVVGNTMRPVTDRLKISREKLAYIVDSTAAPIAAIAFVTTWIGAELSYIQDGINVIGLQESAYNVFLKSLAYSFYPIFTLGFILMIVYRKVEYGPMLRAERKARASDSTIADDEGFSNQLNDLEVSDDIPHRGFNAVIPVMVVILGTMIGLLYTGWDQAVWDDGSIGFTKKLSHIIGNSDSYQALLWSSLSGVIVAVALTLSQRILSLKDSMDSLINGFRTMLTAILILVLAWSLALVTEHLHTADFISRSMLEVSLSPYLVPAITFILSALVAFSTGSSWGTMAILYPLILPSSWLISKEFGLTEDQALTLFYNVVSTVLAGSVLGDHCSPISDTTILSSLASSCNHIEHVRTQLPYALTVGGVSVIIGTIPAAYGISPLLLFPLGFVLMFIIIRIFGKKISI